MVDLVPGTRNKAVRENVPGLGEVYTPVVSMGAAVQGLVAVG